MLIVAIFLKLRTHVGSWAYGHISPKAVLLRRHAFTKYRPCLEYWLTRTDNFQAEIEAYAFFFFIS